ncbi:MAG: type II 3-dehydroquinate dehydratase [Clostridiales bacterium]|nr:type II 3-dehydroquinate dehydratase [Clostridiales bacterium]
MRILVINGPNLNLLGMREPEIYGRKTLQDLEELLRPLSIERGIQLSFFQSNHEGAIIDAIQQGRLSADGIIINPAAYSHTSIAILDALKVVGLPAVEVHLSDITQRESFRHFSYTSQGCIKTIAGKHFQGYVDALDELKKYIHLHS